KVAQKRPLIVFMKDSFQVSERRACRVLPLARARTLCPSRFGCGSKRSTHKSCSSRPSKYERLSRTMSPRSLSAPATWS
ncbi:MAG TPA: hypothetical protein EYG08_13370, partial [Myxococcales bacterium]|nr:hypothetical protein [Myxococcales bacterium]